MEQSEKGLKRKRKKLLKFLVAARGYIGYNGFYYGTKKIINTDFRLCKPVQITANTNREFNIRTRKIEKRWVIGGIEAIPPT